MQAGAEGGRGRPACRSLQPQSGREASLAQPVVSRDRDLRLKPNLRLARLVVNMACIRGSSREKK